MNDDAILLRRYVEDRDEASFAELVKRHIGLVYACALRRVDRDAQLAEDVTQKVFCDLARKAPSLVGRSALSGWLYVSTQLASAELVRKERRRKAREAEALTMEKNLDASAAGPEPDRDQLRAALDPLILSLDDLDREAVVLRFFEQRSFAEVAAALRVSEEAARKRVARAVEKLRGQLARRGVTSTTAALSFVLAEEAVAAAPAALAAQVSGVALAELAAAASGTSLFASLLAALASGTAAVVATLVAGTGLVTWQHQANLKLRAELAGFGNQRQEIGALQRDNRRLAQRAVDVAALRRVQPAPAVSREADPAPPVSAPVNLVVTAKGTILWEGTPVALDDFIGRLAALKTQHPGQDAQLIVHGQPGVAFDPTDYVVEQASKAGIKHIAIDSSATPSPSDNWITSAAASVGPHDNPPPTIPDPEVRP